MKRMSNFELLRIISMLMVITGHLVLAANQLDDMVSVDFYLLNLIQSFTTVAVNVFILISGYFGIKLKIFKLAQLDLRIIIYTYVLFAVSVLIGIHTINLKKDFLFLFPVITKQYWFITIYFVLCLLSPFLNWFLSRQTKRNLKVFLLLGFILFYVVATGAFLTNANQIVEDAGRGIINFIFLYSLGFYLRNHYRDTISSSVKYFGLFLASVLANYLVNIGMTKVFGFYFNSLVSNNTVFVLLGAVFLFLTFKNIKINYFRSINFIASKTFAVYIIHTFPLLQGSIYFDVFKVQNYSGIMLYVIIFAATIAIYAVCFGIDWILDFVVKPIERLLERVMIKKEIKLDD